MVVVVVPREVGIVVILYLFSPFRLEEETLTLE